MCLYILHMMLSHIVAVGRTEAVMMKWICGFMKIVNC